ncbi:MAG: DNA repair protein RecN [Pseudomonadota bacterium]
MIEWLHIRDFAIADQIELSLYPGFTTITGETGSGKSLMVDALSILLGARSDDSWIRHGADEAEIQAEIHVPKGHAAGDWLQQRSLGDGAQCILRRLIRREKPSRGFINGRAVNAGDLREFGNLLVDIHGQHEHHSLMQRQSHQLLLDEAADNQAILDRLNLACDQLNAASRAIEEFEQKQQQTQERMDLLSFQLQELDGLQPTASEWTDLEVHHNRLQHMQDLIAGATGVLTGITDGEHSIVGELESHINTLSNLSQIDPALKETISMLREAEINLTECAPALRSIVESCDVPADEIDRIEHRFSLFNQLSRKHRVAPENLHQVWQSLQDERQTLINPDEQSARLQELLSAAEKEYDALADQLTQRRDKQAADLSSEVTALMNTLGMTGGVFSVDLSPYDDGRRSRSGREQVQYVVSTNPGQPPQPLQKVASGGELSRISLAIQVALAGKTPVSTLIFDEVDIGVGGAVAAAVGEKLRTLGETRQVLCITHLAQVASAGEQHLQVTKSTGDDVSVSIRQLNHTDRVEEIARMSGGEQVTTESLAHAERLLGAA